jgi:hypothetical protein
MCGNPQRLENNMRPVVIISGALANKPFNGGNAWSRLSWILGFKRLGFDVSFVEQISKKNCVSADGTSAAFERSVNVAYFRSALEHFGLEDVSSLICEDGSVCGMPIAELAAHARNAVLFNISGHLTCSDISSTAACRIYYDDDPGFTQFWHASGHPVPGLDEHDFYFTLGQNIGTSDCVIPTNKIAWKHTRPPVVLDEWPRTNVETFDRFTSIASWRGAYGPVEYDGRTYGLKVHEFRKFMEVPARSTNRFEIALQIDPADRGDLDRLIANRWRIVDPVQAAGSPNGFRQYIQRSGAEFSVAQNIYVDTNSGWFSDRTVRYLASGRPALVQDTGFSRHYPVGEGLIAFRTVDEAIDGAERIVEDYGRHCAAARRLAEEFFDSDKVIPRLLWEAGLGVPS